MHYYAACVPDYFCEGAETDDAILGPGFVFGRESEIDEQEEREEGAEEGIGG